MVSTEPTGVSVKDGNDDLTWTSSGYKNGNDFATNAVVTATSSGGSTPNYTLYYNNTDGKLYTSATFSNEVPSADYTGSYLGSGTTLTLENFDFTTTAKIALNLPTGTTLTLAENSSNTVTSIYNNSSNGDSSYGIYANTLTINGSGSLTVTGGDTATPSSSYGLRSTNLTMNGTAEVTVIGGSGANSYGGFAAKLALTGGSLTAEAGTATDNSIALKVTAEPTGISVKDGNTDLDWTTDGYQNSSDFATNAVVTATSSGTTTYTITFDAQGGTVSTTSGTTGTDGKLATLPTPTRSGYTFDGWFTTATGGTAVTTATVFTANDTIYAQWTQTGATTITGVSANPTAIVSTGGSSTITVTGTNLSAGITVTAFDGASPAAPAITGTTDASGNRHLVAAALFSL